MPPTMDDVAQRAGVSKSTVSMVLNDKPGVTPETAEAVLQAVKELGYNLPDRRPLRNPQSRQRNLLGDKYRNFVIVHHVGHEPFDSIYGIFLDYLQGVQAFAKEANINITAIGGYRSGDLDRLEAYILKEQKAPVDGLILMGKGIRRDSKLVRWALALQKPLVVLSRNWPDIPVSTVSQDHQQQAQIALDYLIQLGHRQIAFVAKKMEEAYEWYAPRLVCYRNKMQELNQRVDEGLVVMGEDGAEAIRKLLARRPDVTAILAIHDQRANEAMQGAREMGLEVPKDISIIGLDDSEPAPLGFPRLTTVGFSHFELGYQGAELLLRQIERDHLCFGKLSIRSYLVERDSCAKPKA
ncbi:MAG: LacI family DNA-binding transcriptional regulator [Chloroflexota bacterium]